MEVTRNFIKGRMNKVVDERLVPDGEYIDALNIRMGSTENAEIGVIENTKGNDKLTTLTYTNGTPLSSNARTIGAFEDGANNRMYWFVHDPSFSVGPTGKLDLIVSFDTNTAVLTYHIVSISNSTSSGTTLAFNPSYLITSVDKVGDLLFFTDNINPPRFINVNKGYPSPVGNIDQFDAESILVIKRPPTTSPSISPIVTAGDESFLSDRFVCFAYRYMYADGEYSATSQFSDPSFVPNPFDLSSNSYVNEGMSNSTNAVIISYNSGGALVKGIDLLFKDADGVIIRVIEKLDKEKLGLVDNTVYTYTFSNSKIFTILPESELLRLYDNVPRLAKAQTVMGNRLMYANYVEGYDLIDHDGLPTKLEYTLAVSSEQIGNDELTDSLGNGVYSYNGAQTITGSIGQIDLNGVDLIAGSSISVEFTITHDSFTGDAPLPVETSQNVSFTFSFFLLRSYASVYELATSVEFQDAVGTISNIEPVATSCDGTTFTDQVNCALPNTLSKSVGSVTKFASGISGNGQSIAIITSPSSSVIGFQMVAMRYVNDIVTPTQSVYEYYRVTFMEATFQSISNPKSLHSNRDYELGIVYMDEFGRSTTALVSPNNTAHVPCGASVTKNSIIATIPVTQIAPSWATRYKFVLKSNKDTYETIYSTIFFNDPLTNSTYFLLEGENSRKVQVGDRLIVKSDSNGALNNCAYATVLEVEAKAAGFIEIPSVIDPTQNVDVPGGVYMKINANNFTATFDELSVINNGVIQTDQDTPGAYPIGIYAMNRFDATAVEWIDYTVPAGSRIKLSFKFQRLGTGDGNNGCEKRIYTLEKTLISSANYDNMMDWWNGDNVELILNSGVQDVGGNNCDIGNVYEPTLASSDSDITTDLCNNHYRFFRYPSTPGPDKNKLALLVSGTKRCTGLFAKEKRRSSVTLSVEVFRSDNVFVFETQPVDSSPDIFYENSLSLSINQIGEHAGNIQDQNIGLNQPAIIDTGFFNCYAFGNGVESYKIRDSVTGRSFNLGNRVTAVAAQDYSEVRRAEDITYSGIFSNESNVNKLNEFNSGLLNYKPLEVSFGPIQVIDGRETDVLVLQEDRISYVLAGKNLLSDAAAGGAITSVPEVLGTQIARTEKFGISNNPESYVLWGYDRYFTDVKRGAVLQLKGNSYSNDRLFVVSEQGMRTWFRDEFIESVNTQKLGGYDPYMKEYVLTSNNTRVPVENDCIPCGLSQVFTFSLTGETQSLSYCVGLNQPLGEVVVSYRIVSGSGNATIQTVYNGSTHTQGPTHVDGSFIVNKNSNTVNSMDVTVSSDGPLIIELIVACPTPTQLTVVEVVLTNGSESGETIHAEYRYIAAPYVSPLQSNLVTFASGTSSPLVSRFNSITGNIGTGSIPTNGSTVILGVNKINPDTFDFDPGNNKLRYLRTSVQYNNNPSDISLMLAASTEASPITGAPGYYQAEFNAGSGSGYLYLIWDFRTAIGVELCFSDVSLEDVCCDCTPCESSCISYSFTNEGLSDGQVQYRSCLTNELVTVTVPATTSILACARNSMVPVVVSGNLILIEVHQLCGCPS